MTVRLYSRKLGATSIRHQLRMRPHAESVLSAIKDYSMVLTANQSVRTCQTTGKAQNIHRHDNFQFKSGRSATACVYERRPQPCDGEIRMRIVKSL